MEITFTIKPSDQLTADDFTAIKAAANKLNITSEEFVASAVSAALKRSAEKEKGAA